MARRRFQRFPRKLLYLFVASILLNCSLLLLFKYDSVLDDISWKWPSFSADPDSFPFSIDRSKVFQDSPDIPVMHHAVPFSEMDPFVKYDLNYAGSKVGSLSWGKSELFRPTPDANYQRENGTFFSLVRNSEFEGIITAIESVEARFNSMYHYDWVFANDEPFTDRFIKHVSSKVSGKAHFVTIPSDMWGMPSWIDRDKHETAKKSLKAAKVIYGASESYRHMCRFNAGFFFNLPIMQQYKYYWRVEPKTHFACDLFHTDWFKFMKRQQKVYAFTLAPLELHKTVVNLWRTVQSFIKENPTLLHPGNSMDFVTEDYGESFNLCHYWSNFEIADMDFFRSEAYTRFFNHIDKAGGIYYSRWGDAPIHTIAVSLLLPREQLFHLPDSGYYHRPNKDCPLDQSNRAALRCTCNPKEAHTWGPASCIPRFYEVSGLQKPPEAPQKPFENPHKFTEDENVGIYDDW